MDINEFRKSVESLVSDKSMSTESRITSAHALVEKWIDGITGIEPELYSLGSWILAETTSSIGKSRAEYPVYTEEQLRKRELALPTILNGSPEFEPIEMPSVDGSPDYVAIAKRVLSMSGSATEIASKTGLDPRRVWDIKNRNSEKLYYNPTTNSISNDRMSWKSLPDVPNFVNDELTVAQSREFNKFGFYALSKSRVRGLIRQFGKNVLRFDG